MPDLKLDVHDINVSQQNSFNVGGGVVGQTTVTFYVGTHGPFTLRYDTKDATPARIKNDIKDQVAQLLAIHELGV